MVHAGYRHIGIITAWEVTYNNPLDPMGYEELDHFEDEEADPFKSYRDLHNIKRDPLKDIPAPDAGVRG